MILDLFFILLFLATLVALVVVLVMALRRKPAAKTLLRTLGFVWLVYLSIVFIVAAATPQRVVPFDQDLCFDEMCFAVVQARTFHQLMLGDQPVRPQGTFYVVTVRVSNHSRGRAESELGIRPLLWSAGRSWQTSTAGQRAWDQTHGSTPPLTARLASGQSILTDLVFDLPADVSTPALMIDHGFTPGYFVIGESPLFHKPTVQQLSP